jgi:xanthine dehydrogenase YagR molybdenum-binding subunit
MTITSAGPSAVGAPLDRKDGPLKVRGAATYAGEWPVENPAYLYPLQATIAAGRITGVDTSAAIAAPGVLGVITHLNAPKLAWATDPEVAVLQSDEVAFRGQIVGAVVAETLETARHAAGLVRLEYEQRPHDTVLRADRDDLHRPQHAAIFGSMPGDLQDGSPADSAVGDVDAGLAEAAFTVDATYSTPMNHHNPLEPHTSIAVWTDDEITLYCSSQGVHLHRSLLAGAFGIEAARIRAHSPHVGGAFGSKV